MASERPKPFLASAMLSYVVDGVEKKNRSLSEFDADIQGAEEVIVESAVDRCVRIVAPRLRFCTLKYGIKLFEPEEFFASHENLEGFEGVVCEENFVMPPTKKLTRGAIYIGRGRYDFANLPNYWVANDRYDDVPSYVRIANPGNLEADFIDAV